MSDNNVAYSVEGQIEGRWFRLGRQCKSMDASTALRAYETLVKTAKPFKIYRGNWHPASMILCNREEITLAELTQDEVRQIGI